MIAPDIIRRAAPVLDDLQKAEREMAELRSITDISGLHNLVAHGADVDGVKQSYTARGLCNIAGLTESDIGSAVLVILIERQATKIGGLRAQLTEMGVQV